MRHSRDLKRSFALALQGVLPGFLIGLGSVLDIAGVGGPDVHLSVDPWGADRAALGRDWQRVGDDLRAATEAPRAAPEPS